MSSKYCLALKNLTVLDPTKSQLFLESFEGTLPNELHLLQQRIHFRKTARNFLVAILAICTILAGSYLAVSGGNLVILVIAAITGLAVCLIVSRTLTNYEKLERQYQSLLLRSFCSANGFTYSEDGEEVPVEDYVDRGLTPAGGKANQANRTFKSRLQKLTTPQAITGHIHSIPFQLSNLEYCAGDSFRPTHWGLILTIDFVSDLRSEIRIYGDKNYRFSDKARSVLGGNDDIIRTSGPDFISALQDVQHIPDELKQTLLQYGKKTQNIPEIDALNMAVSAEKILIAIRTSTPFPFCRNKGVKTLLPIDLVREFDRHLSLVANLTQK